MSAIHEPIPPGYVAEPGVEEFCEEFDIPRDKLLKNFNDTLLRRRDRGYTKDIKEDLEKLYEIMKHGRNPPGLLTVTLQTMNDGTFGRPLFKLPGEVLLRKERLREIEAEIEAQEREDDLRGVKRRRMRPAVFYMDEVDRCDKRGGEWGDPQFWGVGPGEVMQNPEAAREQLEQKAVYDRPLDGDWDCPNPECGNVVYGSKTKCGLCHTPRPKPGEASDPKRLAAAEEANNAWANNDGAWANYGGDGGVVE